MSTILRRISGWIVFLAVLAGILFATRQFFQSHSGNTIYIAIAGPMSGDDQSLGDEMIRGARMYLDELNRQGGIDGKQVELLVFDDLSDSDQAASVAQQIAESQAVLVIGHAYSSTSLAAGKIYREAHIPAITASATSDNVTQDNPWYFRTIPNNHSQAVFLANYARYVLGQENVSIVYDNGSYGSSLALPFEKTFRGLGGKVQHTWDFSSDAPDLEQNLLQIVNKMVAAKAQKPGLVFMATYTEEAVTLIREMRRKGLNDPILGGDAIGDPGVPSNFSLYPEEQAQPGFFTDGIYSATALMFDIAGENTQKILETYREEYKTIPGWDVATYYEAAKIATQAIREAGIARQSGGLEADRAAIRNQLAQSNSPETAFDGLEEAVYFDEEHNAQKSIAVGIFNRQTFISAPTQLQMISDPGRIPNLAEAIEAGKVLLVDGKYVYKTSLVYTGLDFIEISELDTKNSTFNADFYLWFRYRGNFDETQIEFDNTTEPIQLGDPVIETINGDETYRVYRAQATFKADFDYRDYPFDNQVLRISFRHPSITRENLIYVPDVVGMRYTSGQETIARLERAGAFNAGNSWNLESIEFFQGVEKYDSTLGNPAYLDAKSEVEFSSFGTNVYIQRDVIRFATKNLIPLFLLVAIAYTAFLFTPDLLSERFGLGTGSLLTTAFFHMSFVSELPQIGYVVAMEYVFYGIYTLYVVIIITAFSSYMASNNARPRLAQNLNRVGAITYEAIILIGLVMLDHSYQITSLPKPPAPQTAAAQSAPAPETTEVVTLRLGSWRADDTDAMNRLLATFNAAHPNIQVVYEPSVDTMYQAALNAQLANGTAPDLFYIRSYATSLKLYRQGYLEPLDSIPAVLENFSPEALSPWATADGVHFGVPFIATSHGIYYNADVFKQLDLPLPKTWDELIKTAATLKENGHIPFANGTADQWTAAEIMFMNLAPSFLDGREGRLAYLAGERCFNDYKMISAFRAIADLSPYLPENQADLNYYQSLELFLQGKAIMWMGGSWDIPYFEAQNPAFAWSVMAVPPPAGKPGVVTFHPDAGIGLNAASMHKDAARVFIEWISTPEFGELMGEELPGFFAMHTQAKPLSNKHANAFLSLNQKNSTDVRFAWEELMEGLPSGYDLIQDGTIDVLAGKLTPRQAADNLQNGLARWFGPAQDCLAK